ncbi:MAG: hypothetical protein GEV09_21940 [Pseudonocardiaceae bacterium]|nr:hypothetical protein [Pseudonocardiaceae bacterium]
MRARGVLLAVLLAATVPTGCARSDPGRSAASLIVEYFAAANAAAGRGPAAQQRFFEATQHPDFRDEPCPLQGITVVSEPAMATLRPDPDWLPAGARQPPRGTSHVVAVTATVHRGQADLGTQIGSEHVVVLDGRAYGFAPCPS